jgi:hypothetical protein
MSKVGPSSSVDLVKQMQSSGGLQNAWIMFNHGKLVKPRTTMAYYVYYFVNYFIVIIAICDM